MQCGVVCLLYGCVTLVLPMFFFSSSQVVLVFVMCDSASHHILFYYCLRLRCRNVARARVPALPSLLASRHLRHRLITLKISPSSFRWPCRNNSSLFCRYSWLRPTTLSTPTPAVHCHDHKVCGDNVFHCSMVHGCHTCPISSSQIVLVFVVRFSFPSHFYYFYYYLLLRCRQVAWSLGCCFLDVPLASPHLRRCS